MDGTPVDVALSPDGKTIAYTFVSASCPVGASCGARAATGYVTSHRRQRCPATSTSATRAGWATRARWCSAATCTRSTRTTWALPRTCTGSTTTRSSASPTRPTSATASSARQGDKLALVRGYGSDTHIMWYTTTSARRCRRHAVRDRQARGPLRADVGARRPVARLGRAGRRLGQAERARLRRAAVARASPAPREPDWGPAEPRRGRQAEADREGLAQARRPSPCRAPPPASSRPSSSSAARRSRRSARRSACPARPS